MRQHIGVGGQLGRGHVQRLVAHHILIAHEMLQHHLVIVLAMTERGEAVLDVDGIAGPIQRRGVAQQRAAAAIHHAFDQLELGIVIGRAGILVHIEAGKALHPFLVAAAVRRAQRHQVEDGEAFAIVLPVELAGKFLVIHAVLGDRHVGGFLRRILRDMAFIGLGVHLADDVVAAQGIEMRPVIDILDGVVGAVIAAITRRGLQPARRLVEIALEELRAGGGMGMQQFALQQAPIPAGPSARRW